MKTVHCYSANYLNLYLTLAAVDRLLSKSDHCRLPDWKYADLH